ncbi:MAG: hypothetical protein M3352_04165, partial [Bacteroidota bacterium]|nr:hypothetical protein [Bacteroidota bacterium]
MNRIYILLLSFSFSLYACKTANKAYDKGNYTNAIELAIKKLQKNPNDGESKALAKNAYNNAVNKYQGNIRSLSNTTSDSRFVKLYNEYRQLQNLYLLVKGQPSLFDFILPVDYSDYVETYQNKSAEVHYQKGLTLLNQDNKTSFREAHNEFKTALKYTPDDIAIRKKMEEAYQAAVVNVVVLSMDQNYGGYQYSSSYQIRNFEEDIIRNLRYQLNNDFVQLFSEWDAKSRNIEADEILEMRLGRMEIGRPYDQTQTRNVSKEVVIREIVYKPDSVVKQYGTVHAQIAITRRTMVSEGDLHVSARDVKGRVLWNDIFRGEHRWQTEFATYRGDE